MKRLEYDSKYVKICAYSSVTVLVTLALALVLINSGGFFSKAWDLITDVGAPIVYGALICYLLLPLVRRLSDWLEEHNVMVDNPRSRLNVSVALTVVGVLLIVLAFAFTLVIVITHSLESVNFDTLREMWANAEGDITKLGQNILKLVEQFGLTDMSNTSKLFSTFGQVTNVFSRIIFSIIFAIYFLLDGQRVWQYVKRVFYACFGEYLGPDLSTYIEDANNAFSGYIRGQFVDALTVGTLTSLIYSIIGVPYGPLIGLFTGLGNLIPYVGGPVGFLTTILICLAEGDVGRLIAGLIALSIIMFVDANFINPRLLSHTVEVHPLVVVIALIVGGSIGGLAGMLVSVPSAAFLKIQLERWLEKREAELADVSSVGKVIAGLDDPKTLSVDEKDL